MLEYFELDLNFGVKFVYAMPFECLKSVALMPDAAPFAAISSADTITLVDLNFSGSGKMQKYRQIDLPGVTQMRWRAPKDPLLICSQELGGLFAFDVSKPP